MNTALESPISMNELWHAISKEKSHKAPGQGGIGIELYKAAWETTKIKLLQVMNCMYLSGTSLGKQLQGLFVCIPKHDPSKNYRRLQTPDINEYKLQDLEKNNC